MGKRAKRRPAQLGRLEQLGKKELDTVAKLWGIKRDRSRDPRFRQRIAEAARCWRCSAGLEQERGQPLALTPELESAVLGHIEKGNRVETSFAAEGIGHETQRIWKQKALAGDSTFADFFGKVARAYAKAETTIVGKLSDGESERNRSNRALQFILETTRRGAFGPTVRVKVEEAKETLLDVAQGALEPEAFEDLVQALGAHGEAMEAEPGLPGPRRDH